MTLEELNDELKKHGIAKVDGDSLATYDIHWTDERTFSISVENAVESVTFTGIIAR